MKPSPQLLLLLFLLLPTAAYAHGEEILSTFFLILGSLVLFCIVVLLIPIAYTEKAVLVVVYLVTMGGGIYFTNGLPYLVNMRLINTTIGLAPVVACTAAFLFLWNRRRSRNQHE